MLGAGSDTPITLLRVKWFWWSGHGCLGECRRPELLHERRSLGQLRSRDVEIRGQRFVALAPTRWRRRERYGNGMRCPDREDMPHDSQECAVRCETGVDEQYQVNQVFDPGVWTLP